LDALEKLETGAFDVVLTDWNMPRMDGLTLLQTIRQSEVLRRARIDGHRRRQEDNIIAAAHAGADGYIVKPFTAATLGEKLDRIFGRLGEA
jgi:two-component system chemotaxis response regulator CheY